MKNPSKFLGNELKYIQQVLNSENWSCTAGTWVQEFEKRFAEKLNAKYAIAMNSGTSTLHAALEALGVKAGDEVITPALTVIMDTTAILHCNAIPVYADIDPVTFTINPFDVKKKITNKTKAIIAVSLYGLSPDYDKLKEIAGDIPIIEDNAQCVLATYKDKLLGTIGEFGSYSFENSKHLSCGEGGMLITNNEELATKARKLAGHGFKNLQAIDGRVRMNPDIFQDPNYKRHDVLGWNYRMSEFLGAIGLAQLERVDELIDLRRQSAKLFIDILDPEWFQVQESYYKADNDYYTLAVMYKGDDFINQGPCWKDFRKKFIELGGHPVFAAWSVPYLEPVILTGEYKNRNYEIYKDVKLSEIYCPVAESIQPKIMQFKTNYRNLDIAKEQSIILQKTIQYFKRG